MITWCAEKIADWLIECEAVKESEKELYSYAAYSFLLSFFPILFGVIMGFVMGGLKQSIFIMIPFAVIRKFSGGYHAKHSWVCLIFSSLLLFLCIGLSFCARQGMELAMATFAAAIVLWIFSPVDSENRRLDADEKRKYKRITVKLTRLFMLLDFVFFLCGLSVYSVCISIGIILTACLQLPCIVNQVKIMALK